MIIKYMLVPDYASHSIETLAFCNMLRFIHSEPKIIRADQTPLKIKAYNGIHPNLANNLTIITPRFARPNDSESLPEVLEYIYLNSFIAEATVNKFKSSGLMEKSGIADISAHSIDFVQNLKMKRLNIDGSMIYSSHKSLEEQLGRSHN